MKGNKISEQKLKEEGWKYVLTYGGSLKLFKKDNERILWDSENQTITHEFINDFIKK